jgi:hypothetical protein
MIHNRGPRGRPTGGPKRKKPDTRASVVPVSTPRSAPKRVRSGDPTNPVTPRMAAQRKKLFDAANKRRTVKYNAAAEERGVSPSAKVRQNPSPRLQTPKAGRGVVPPAKVRQNPSPRQQINFTPVPKAGQGQTLREQTIRQAASKRKAPTKPNTAGRGPSNRGNTGK